MNTLFSRFAAVVDSGVGGLTVLADLREKYPRCNFLYLADSAYCPYGTRSEADIRNRVHSVVGWLARRNVAAVVLACNTASLFADSLRDRFDLPIYDVVAPTCRLAAATTVNKRVAVLATEATVRGNVYPKLLAEYGVNAVQTACSGFVPFVEGAAVGTDACDSAVDNALKDLPRTCADTVILGCTHFPVLRDKIVRYTGSARIVQCVVDFVPPSVCLSRRHGKCIFFTTGDASAANKASEFFSKARFVHTDI